MSAEQVRILVVDDEETVRNLLKRMLEDAGYAVDTAANGEEALNELSSNENEVVLLDIKMPGISGLDLLARLTAERPDTCAIMITAVADTQTAVQAMKLGAYDYITKPFDRDEMVKKVRQARIRWNQQLHEKHQYEQLKERFTEQTRLMRNQFEELVASLSREHKLLLKLAAKRGERGKQMLSELPPELREPKSSAEEFRDALLRILREPR